jgi:succinate-semialdehyde dehydrogenase / glutarate-semialdehyde dehydrogenase
MKPSKETPGVAVLLVRALEEAGVPPGVVNMVFGHPAHVSTQLLESPGIRLLALRKSGFTSGNSPSEA